MTDPQTVRVQIGPWINRGWEWFMQDLAVSSVVGLVATAITSLLGGLLTGPVAAGLAMTGIRKSQRGQAEFQDFFSGFSYFLPAFLSSLLIFLFTLVGLIFLVVPGLVILAMYMFTFHYMVDRGEDFWQAMESSRRLVSRDYFGFVAFGLLLAGINILGLMLLGLGVIVTLPVTFFALTAAYVDCAGALVAPPEAAVPIRID